MLGCYRCEYNENNFSKLECYQCDDKYNEISRRWYDVYAYVTNTYKCFNNSDPNEPSFYGCLKSYYNETSNKYECQICSNYDNNYYNKHFIMVANEKICKIPDEMNLTNCLEAENIENESKPLYSCLKCNEDTVKIRYKDNHINCHFRDAALYYCLEGIMDENDNVKCKTCASNSHLNGNNICECDSDSFGQYNKVCYKCDDRNYGIPGCKKEKGCIYYHSNGQIDCNECKDGFFNYTQGQCYPCSYEIRNCEKCHYDNSNSKVICDKCPEEYSYNSNEKKCEMKNCEEYPEISEGCIICEEKLEKYLSSKTCQKCKPGYLKTKKGQCLSCKSEETGGLACYKCKYTLNEKGEETEEIRCEYCPKEDHVYTTDGKCYNCKTITPNCDVCDLVKNNDNTEKVECILCKPGYYLNSKKRCIYYLNYLETIPNCYEYKYTISNITFYAYLHYYNYEDKYEDGIYYIYAYYYYMDYDNNLYTSYEQYIAQNYIIPEINSIFKGECIECQNGFPLNYDDGKCEEIKPEY